MFKRIFSGSAWWALALVLLSSFSLMLWASRTDSAIMDELAHIPAGYGYVHNLDYRLNPEHPPLVKALAMLPVLFLSPTFPTDSDAWKNHVNSQWDMGAKFLYKSGNNADAIIRAARIFPIILTILLIVFTYLLARGLIGNWWALLPATLLGLSPTILAHGHYVTTDVGAAFGVVFATYYFLKFIETPSRKHLWYAGLSFGVAQIIKFSMPFLVLLFVFLIFVLWLREVITKWSTTTSRGKTFLMSGFRWAWRLILIFAIGYIFIVYPVYFLFTLNYPIAKQVSDTQFVLGSFADGPTPAGQFCRGMRCLADLDIYIAHNPILRPIAEYMLGILMVFQRVSGGNTIYFLGHVAGSGGWIYFPFLFLLKEPIPTLAIILIALFLGIYWTVRPEPRGGRGRWRRIKDYLGVNFAEFAMISFIVLYWGYSLQSDLNIGVRHLLPTIPFILILSSVVWRKWVTKIDIPTGENMTFRTIATAIRSFARSFLKYIFLILLITWLFLETIFAAPYFLSYFNEIGGGISSGYRYVTDSNYDWGQDLSRLRSWLDAHPDVDKIAVDYFGGGNTEYYLGARGVNWSSNKGNPADEGIRWLAVSVNSLEGATQPLGPGQIRSESDTYSWLTALRPPAAGFGEIPQADDRAGTSIFIYHL